MIKNSKIHLWIGMLMMLFASIANAKICIQLPNIPTGDFIFEDDISIPSFDGSNIAANLFTPTKNKPEAGFPAIIFVNSWVLEEHEYIFQAKEFAKNGYLVLSYSARGWGCSDGEVDVAGEKDMADLSRIVEWLDANTEVDMNNIGIGGISYGSGISLMGLAKVPQIKTAVAMSTWGSLVDSLYQHDTARLFWGFFLVSSGFITADLDPEIAESYFNLLMRRNIPETREWANERSVSHWVHLINERNAPVYLANNFGDNLFQPNNILRLFEDLTVPKRLDLNQGSHASAEGFGLVSLENYTWNNARLWFDYWLKGEENGIMSQNPVTMQVTGTKERVEYSSWPTINGQERKFFLEPRSMLSDGRLRTSTYDSWWMKSNRILSGFDTRASTGIPFLSEILEAHLNFPVKTPLRSINSTNGIFFKSEVLDERLRIRGIPEVTVNVKPSLRQFQLNAYLYDVDPNGVGTLITHGPVTRYDAEANRTQKVNWELVATAYDIPRGHRVALAIDTFDALYAVPTLLPYSLEFKFKSGLNSMLTLPVEE
ncbi:CocE/NonD family hydrolase [Pleionea sediminis]|uniref:CocE/NonD family hydrolase n=1 Tax=Pleionea sediminis TaxID=2569479 RepID=UPI0011866E9A|nr:CocE/NonD family hydrolase [Pleionea sediminis]